jgi:hypothetical protein
MVNNHVILNIIFITTRAEPTPLYLLLEINTPSTNNCILILTLLPEKSRRIAIETRSLKLTIKQSGF